MVFLNDSGINVTSEVKVVPQEEQATVVLSVNLFSKFSVFSCKNETKLNSSCGH